MIKDWTIGQEVYCTNKGIAYKAPINGLFFSSEYTEVIVDLGGYNHSLAIRIPNDAIDFNQYCYPSLNIAVATTKDDLKATIQIAKDVLDLRIEDLV